MPPQSKKAAAGLPELPDYLEEFLAALEAQVLAGGKVDRDGALRPIEQRLKRMLDIDEELQEHPEAAARYKRIRRRLEMRIEDGAIEKAGEGRASAMPVLRAMQGAPGGSGKRSGNGSDRLQLGREHRAKIAGHRSGW